MLLTVNSQIQALCEEGFSLPRLCLLAWIGRVLGHQFEDVEKEFVKGAASLKVLGIIGTQLQKLLRQVNILKKKPSSNLILTTELIWLAHILSYN